MTNYLRNHNNWNRLLASCFVVFISVNLSMTANAGPRPDGYISGGFVESVKNKIGAVKTSLGERHKIAIEYAFSSPEFQKALSHALIIKAAALGGVLPDITEAILAIEEQFHRDRKSKVTGKTMSYWKETLIGVLEAAVPDLGVLTYGKIAAAWAAAYVWGFVYGQ